MFTSGSESVETFIDTAWGLLRMSAHRVVKKQITDTFNLRLKFYARVWISYFKIVILINVKQLCFLNEPMIKILNVNETN